MKALKIICGCLGCIGFFASGVVVALQARHYQVLAQPMPNGKGGFMTFRDGYSIAIILVLMSIPWFLMVRRFWHSHEPTRQP
jgi:hypothetical protein